jgi:hypothetical protein
MISQEGGPARAPVAWLTQIRDVEYCGCNDETVSA